jgi:alginate O-acetyltransferase complex protein AlgI
VAAFVALLAPNSIQIMSRYRPAMGNPEGTQRTRSALLWRPTVGWAFLTTLLLILCMLKLSDVSEFIYFQF